MCGVGARPAIWRTKVRYLDRWVGVIPRWFSLLGGSRHRAAVADLILPPLYWSFRKTGEARPRDLTPTPFLLNALLTGGAASGGGGSTSALQAYLRKGRQPSAVDITSTAPCQVQMGKRGKSGRRGRPHRAVFLCVYGFCSFQVVVDLHRITIVVPLDTAVSFTLKITFIPARIATTHFRHIPIDIHIHVPSPHPQHLLSP